MRRSIRRQILIPLIAVQTATVSTIALVEAALATSRAEGQVLGRLEGVVETLGRSRFPLTGQVLAQMSGLSGAEFVTTDGAGRILESTLPGLAELPTSLRSLPSRARLDPTGSSSTRELRGEGYFAASVRSATGPTLLVLYPEAAWRRARWEAGLPPIALGLLSMIPMAIVSGMVAHRFGVRLRSVQARVSAIATGDFRGPGLQRPGDEIDALTGSVGRMAEQLGLMRETIRRAERLGLLAQLAAGLAHQIRNAATGARMAIQLHARRCRPPDSDTSLDVALRQLQLCEGQIKRLLAPGRTPTLPRAEDRAGAVIEEVAALVEANCRHRGVTLACRSDAPAFVSVEPEDFRAALLNLTLNAIEASESGDTVELSATLDGDSVAFEVTDQGPGPPPDLADDLFEPFVSGKPEGIGLGLALARRVALDHSGELTWSRIGDRTRFRLAIPAVPPTALRVE